MSHKHLYILTTIVISLVSFLSGYLLIQFKSDNLAATIQRSEDIQGFKVQTVSVKDAGVEIKNETGKVMLLESDPVTAAVNAADSNSVIYYLKNTGQVNQANLKTGNQEIISDGILKNFLDTIWSPSREEVISGFFTGSGKEYKYYNYKTKQSRSLGKNIQNVAFSPDGKYIARFELQKDRNEISISEPDGTIKKLLLATRLSDIELDWPSEEFISFRYRDTKNNDNLFLLGLDGQLDLILSDLRGLEYNWSTSGKSFIYSYSNDDNKTRLNLFVAGQDKDLPASTGARSCGWKMDGVSIICAIRDETTGMNNLLEINTSTNLSKIKVTDIGITAKEIFISRLEDYAIVTSPEGSLYRVRLAN